MQQDLHQISTLDIIKYTYLPILLHISNFEHMHGALFIKFYIYLEHQ